MDDDPGPEYPGDPRHPDHEKYLLALGQATYQAALLTGICYDILRVWADVDGGLMEREALGTLKNRLTAAGKRTAGLEGELASLERWGEFMTALEVAVELRNDLIHALPTAYGLARRGSRYLKVAGGVWSFFTAKRVDDVTRVLELAHNLGGYVLYGDGGTRVQSWYEKHSTA